MVAANRDEFYARPTAPTAFWPDHPQVFAGRDLEKGGTWLGVTPAGRFAALTNYRDPPARRAATPSRGLLVSGFLTGQASPREYLCEVARRAAEYEDFNLVVGEGESLWYCASRGGAPRELAPGVYALSNHLLDTPWPKVRRARALFEAALARPDADGLLALLADRAQPPDAQLPATGVSLEWERRLAPVFIASPEYGTRASTALLIGADGAIEFVEANFAPNGQPIGAVRQHIAGQIVVPEGVQ